MAVFVALPVYVFSADALVRLTELFFVRTKEVIFTKKPNKSTISLSDQTSVVSTMQKICQVNVEFFSPDVS